MSSNNRFLTAALENVRPIVFALSNILSVTAIVAVNKVVFSSLHFNFPITLVCIHTIITYIGMRGAALFGAFELKALPVKPRLILAASFVFYNVASLINLSVNTVGFYQISKILITPTVMVMQYVMSGTTTNTQIKMAVGIMLVGVTLATVTDVDVTPTGFVIGMLAVLGAAQSQILIGHYATQKIKNMKEGKERKKERKKKRKKKDTRRRKSLISPSLVFLFSCFFPPSQGDMQKKLGASANQLLVAYTPFVMVMLVIVSPLELMLKENSGKGFAVYNNWIEENLSMWSVGVIVLSGCFGLLVSLSTFLMIGATSALTYNIVGHLKTVCILMTGFIFFHDSMGFAKFFGIVCALAGVFWYSKIKMDEQESSRNAPSPSKPALKPDLEAGVTRDGSLAEEAKK
jgi:solute carrier family 35 protein E3